MFFSCFTAFAFSYARNYHSRAIFSEPDIDAKSEAEKIKHETDISEFAHTRSLSLPHCLLLRMVILYLASSAIEMNYIRQFSQTCVKCQTGNSWNSDFTIFPLRIHYIHRCLTNWCVCVYQLATEEQTTAEKPIQICLFNVSWNFLSKMTNVVRCAHSCYYKWR